MGKLFYHEGYPHNHGWFYFAKFDQTFSLQSFQMDLYKVHNLPAFHLELGKQFSNILEGKFCAISKHGLHAIILKEHDIRFGVATEDNNSC